MIETTLLCFVFFSWLHRKSFSFIVESSQVWGKGSVCHLLQGWKWPPWKEDLNPSLMRKNLKQLLCFLAASESNELVEYMSTFSRWNGNVFKTASKDPMREAFLLMNRKEGHGSRKSGVLAFIHWNQVRVSCAEMEGERHYNRAYSGQGLKSSE